MTERPSADDHKQRVMVLFNTIAAEYDTLRFVQVCAQRLIELAALPTGARVLDIATGTGLVAMAAAHIVGPIGSVTGVDLSPEMLARARQKLATTDLRQVTFQQGDAERLDFPGQSFDAVLCASSLFFVPNMLTALQEFRRVLVPDGSVGFSGFGATFLQPLRDLWGARLHQYGMAQAPAPTQRLADPAVCQQLLAEAGFAEIEVRSEQLGYYLTIEQRWDEIRTGIEAIPLAQLTAAQREQIKAEHLEELAAHATDQGLWIDVPVNFALARRSVTA